MMFGSVIGQQLKPADPNRVDMQKRVLDELRQYMLGEDLRSRHAPPPPAAKGEPNLALKPDQPAHVEYMGHDGAMVEKAGTTGADGLPEAEPSLLLKDLDDEAVRKLLGE